MNENINAAKENILLRGYFDRKKRAAQKVIDDAAKKQTEEQEDIKKEAK